MGGKALKTVEVSRMNKIQLAHVKEDVFSRLSPHLRIDFTRELPEKDSYGDLDVVYWEDPALAKVDIDQMKNKQSGRILPGGYATQLVAHTFNTNGIVKSGDVFSFPYSYRTGGRSVEFDCETTTTTEGDSCVDSDQHVTSEGNGNNKDRQLIFQVDMIKCNNEEHHRFMKFYFSYGDVGGKYVVYIHGLQYHFNSSRSVCLIENRFVGQVRGSPWIKVGTRRTLRTRAYRDSEQTPATTERSEW